MLNIIDQERLVREITVRHNREPVWVKADRFLLSGSVSGQSHDDLIDLRQDDEPDDRTSHSEDVRYDCDDIVHRLGDGYLRFDFLVMLSVFQDQSTDGHLTPICVIMRSQYFVLDETQQVVSTDEPVKVRLRAWTGTGFIYLKFTSHLVQTTRSKIDGLSSR